ncbi:MAG: RDD family protein [Pseudonocardiaceae bacterium]
MTVPQSPQHDAAPSDHEQLVEGTNSGDQPADLPGEPVPAAEQPSGSGPAQVISSALDPDLNDQTISWREATDPPAQYEASQYEASQYEASQYEASETSGSADAVMRVAPDENSYDASADATQVVAADVMNAPDLYSHSDRSAGLAPPPPLHSSPPRGFPVPPSYGQVPTAPPPQHGQPLGQFPQQYSSPHDRPFTGSPTSRPIPGPPPRGFSAAPPPYAPPPYGQPPYGQPPYAPPPYAPAAPYGQPPGQPPQYRQAPPPPYQQYPYQHYGQLPPYAPPQSYGPPSSAAQQPYGVPAGPERAGQQRGSAPPDLGREIAALPGPLADFGARTVSFLIDNVAPFIALLVVMIFVSVTVSGDGLILALSAVGYLVLLAFAVWNSGYQQGTTGQSIGRRVAKTKLVKLETGEPVGFGMALLRQICHGVEFGIGYLWPLWDPKRQTFADKIVGTVVVRVGNDHDD